MNLAWLNRSKPSPLAIDLLISAVSLANIVLGVTFFLYPYVAATDGADEFLIELFVMRVFYIFSFAVFLYLFMGVRHLFKIKDFYLPVAGLALLLVTCAVNGNYPNPMVFIGVSFSFFIFTVLTRVRFDYSFPRPVLWSYMAYLLVPVFLVVLFRLAIGFGAIDAYHNSGFYRAESFRGIAQDRTQYAYFSGIIILVLLVSRIRYRIPLLLVLIPGLVMSESRAALLSLFLCTLFYYRKGRGKWIISGSVVLIGAYLAFEATRQMVFGDPGDRSSIFAACVKYVSSDIQGLLVGKGSFYNSIYIPDFHSYIPAHNSIIQSIINFGVPVTLLWAWYLIVFWRRLQNQGKMIFIYWGVFGMFQTGFDAYLFLPPTMMCLLLAAVLGTMNHEAVATGEPAANA